MDEHRRTAASHVQRAELVFERMGDTTKPWRIDYELKLAQIHATLHLAEVIEKTVYVRIER